MLKRVLYFLLGLMGWLGLLCSVAAVQAASAPLMKQGFLQFSQTAHLDVPASRYADYAAAIGDYLNGKTDLPRVPAYDGTGGVQPAFSEKENAHLADVRGLVTALKACRYVAGGGAAAVVAALYLLKKKERPAVLQSAVRGFALSALFLLGVGLMLAVWGVLNFPGLFWTFHQIAFRNDLWLLDPQKDLLMALMPLPFFSWYAGSILKSLAPILLVMLLTVIAYFRIRTKESNS